MGNSTRAYFFIGGAGGGRSKLRRGFNTFHGHRGFIAVEHDDWLWKKAKLSHEPLDIVREFHLEEAKAYAAQTFKRAATNKMPLLIDVDDLATVEERKRYLDALKGYDCIAFVCKRPGTLRDRYDKIKEPWMSWEEVEQSWARLETVSPDEGFSAVVEKRVYP